MRRSLPDESRQALLLLIVIFILLHFFLVLKFGPLLNDKIVEKGSTLSWTPDEFRSDRDHDKMANQEDEDYLDKLFDLENVNAETGKNEIVEFLKDEDKNLDEFINQEVEKLMGKENQQESSSSMKSSSISESKPASEISKIETQIPATPVKEKPEAETLLTQKILAPNLFKYDFMAEAKKKVPFCDDLFKSEILDSDDVFFNVTKSDQFTWPDILDEINLEFLGKGGCYTPPHCISRQHVAIIVPLAGGFGKVLKIDFWIHFQAKFFLTFIFPLI